MEWGLREKEKEGGLREKEKKGGLFYGPISFLLHHIFARPISYFCRTFFSSAHPISPKMHFSSSFVMNICEAREGGRGERGRKEKVVCIFPLLLPQTRRYGWNGWMNGRQQRRHVLLAGSNNVISLFFCLRERSIFYFPFFFGGGGRKDGEKKCELDILGSVKHLLERG